MARGKKTGGRRAGTPNKSTRIVKEALWTAFEGLGGVSAFTQWAQANPNLFYSMLPKMLPSEINAKHSGEVRLPQQVIFELHRDPGGV